MSDTAASFAAYLTRCKLYEECQARLAEDNSLVVAEKVFAGRGIHKGRVRVKIHRETDHGIVIEYANFDDLNFF